MKKNILLMALLIGCAGVHAQGLVSKKGEPILPEAGDWALGIDARPFLEYAGNFFGKANNNNSPGFNFLGNQLIIGKYFVDSSTAYRAGLRIGINNNTTRSMVNALPVTGGSVNTFPEPLNQVENSWMRSFTNIGVTGGIEKRRGKTRLQGYYGGELGLFYSSTRDEFRYGNSLNATPGQVVNVSGADNFGGAGNVQDQSGSIPGVIGMSRITERKSGATFAFGVRGFIGVEYFVLPKISIGGEFGWGLGLGMTGKSSTRWESIGNNGGGGSNVTGNTTFETPAGRFLFIDTDNNNSFFGGSGSLRLNFHF